MILILVAVVLTITFGAFMIYFAKQREFIFSVGMLFFFGMALCLLIFLVSSKVKEDNYNGGCYYQPAEIVEEAQTDNGNWEITFMFVEENPGHMFIWESDYHMPDDVPYLLTMAYNGTKAVTDDEIVVIWKCMD